MNQLGSSRAGQYSNQGTLNSVRTVQIPNTIMNATDKSPLLQGNDNMTNAYQHFLSTQGQQHLDHGTPQGRKLQSRTKIDQQIDIRAKKKSVPPY